MKTTFFKRIKPKWWYAEGYFAHDYTNIDDFLADLAAMAAMHPRGADQLLMHRHCKRLRDYYSTAEGTRSLELYVVQRALDKEALIFEKSATVAAFEKQRRTVDDSHIQAQTLPIDDNPEPLVQDVSTLYHPFEQPWRTLIQASLDRANGHTVEDLQLPSEIDLSQLEEILLSQVLGILSKGQLATSDFKSLYTALSGIVDTRQLRVDQVNLLSEPLVQRIPGIDNLMKLLKSHARLGPRGLILGCDILLGKYAQDICEMKPVPDEINIIRVVQKLSLMIEHNAIPKSEQEVVALWKGILELISDGKLNYVRQVLQAIPTIRATTTQKKALRELFSVQDDTESGRKVDLLLIIDGLEALNSEAKLDERATLGEQQYQKNLRVNHSIRLAAEQQGVQLDSMAPLDIRGTTGMICGLKAQEGLLVAGSACNQVIELPSNKEDLEAFITGDSPHILWNYVDSLLEYQKNVRAQLKKKKATSLIDPLEPGLDSDNNGGCRTPPAKSVPLGKLTVFTPKKSKKRHLK
ncbi:hypothetical protein BGW39_001147 [Mortierella sp. 14UC]|nr:hypothetical protein BGW39_001147 [Mortierella sp. 14UC]